MMDRDEARFELRAVLDDAAPRTVEAQMLATNSRAYAKALDMQARIAAGGLIDGYNAAQCSDKCGQTIVFKDWDQGGPDHFQPNGFKCDACDEWCIYEHGDREKQICDACQAYVAAQAFATLGLDLQDAAFKGDFAAVLTLLKKSVTIDVDLSRRARILDLRRPRPVIPMDSCDPKTCTECQQGAVA